MSMSKAVLRAKNEINEERTEKAVAKLKALYRDELEAKEVRAAIQRKIELEEAKVNESLQAE